MRRSARLPCWKGRAGLGMMGRRCGQQQCWSPALNGGVVVLGDCTCRNTQSAPVPGAGRVMGLEQGPAVPRQQLCFSSGLEELAELQQ